MHANGPRVNVILSHSCALEPINSAYWDRRGVLNECSKVGWNGWYRQYVYSE
jgi:hypothetical protein